MSYYSYGGLARASGSDGSVVTMSADSATNYAAPQSIGSATYSETIAYNGWLGVTATTGLNGEQLQMSYDSFGRPISATSPFVASTSYGYAN